MRHFRWLAILTSAWLLLAGCHLTWVRPIRLEVRLTNDRNELLTVEGNTTLPDGALVEARLSQSDGRRWASGRGWVNKGHYYIVLEVNRCPGFKPLNLDVFFDPLLASASVQQAVGMRGEAMSGDLLVESHDRILVLKRTRVILTMSARDMAVRRLQLGDGDVNELQSYLVRHPNDPESLIGLGLAYLKHRPSQQHVHSDAYKLLQQGVLGKPASNALEMEGRLWIARLDEKAKREAEERERRKAPTYSSRFVSETQIRPGQALGAFQLGMGEQFLRLSFQLRPTQVKGQYSIDALPGLLLGFTEGGALVRASTTDTRYRTQEGIGPGSDVEELKRVLPSLSISFTAPEVKADGRAYRYATVELKGLNLYLEQSYDPNFPLPESTVKQVEVYLEAP
ncbi:hypothetical protein ABS71_15255 [bacterium SCN 62-11]|nr:hypothetical protein [Candidatus Eremiobacteraeota bacterium]ODT62758.1 MAG: hypothetical protein ABS71_15255 [bacterium SCN 62-11]